MELYNYRKVTDYWLRRIKESYPEYADTASRFIDALRLAGIGEGKVKDYAQLSLRILECNSNNKNYNNNNKHIKEWGREDVDRIASMIISKKDWSYSTIAIVLRTLKRLVHYAKHNTIADGYAIKYCYKVEHIHPDRYKKRAEKEEKVKATDLITREEFDRMVECIPRVSRYPIRDKAMLYVMYELLLGLASYSICY